MKATPGPWVFEDGSVISDRDGSVICEVHNEDDFPCLDEDNSADQMAMLRAEFAANARLIAAAPELLEALKELRDAVRREPSMNNMKYDALGVLVNDAIAKAEGAQ